MTFINSTLYFIKKISTENRANAAVIKNKGINIEECIALPDKTLIDEGFEVLVYCSDDPIFCKELDDAGCVAIMPLASPIGSGLGIINPYNLSMIIEDSQKPVIVDAGVGTASDASRAMELGCDGILMNTAVAMAQNPILMASAMKKAVLSGREAYLAGRMPKKNYGSASSPKKGLIE